MAKVKSSKGKRRKFAKNRKKKRRESTSSEEEWVSSGKNSGEEENGDEPSAMIGPWSYNLEEMLLKEKFEFKDAYQEMDASDFTVQYVKENGLEAPLLFKDSLSSLGMKMPKDGTLTARDVLNTVGNRSIEVVDVMTQGSKNMMLSDFVDYYESPQERRKDLLNLLSLEFSLTPLANIIQAPSVAREIDWVELFWPKKSRTSSVSYPKVQNYCLMSVKRSFTDFHIDFGGTSVWYHVYKGRKIFWLVEPTEENIVKYEKWILEGSQREAFYGWIHAVYTPEDSLVFGGNFLHSFSIPMQIRINRSENTLMIKRKYRYPRYSEMLWFVIEGIVNKADGLVQETAKNEDIKNRTYAKDSKEISKITCCGETSMDAAKIAKDDSGDENGQNSDSKKEITLLEVKTDVTHSTAIQGGSSYKQEEKCLAFGDEYLAMSGRERDGYKLLLIEMRQEIKGYYAAYRRSKGHLLDCFEKVINDEVSGRLIPGKKSFEEQTAPKLNQWLDAFMKTKSSGVKKKISSKEKITESSPQVVRPRPPKYKLRASKKQDHHKPDGPLIVGGIPPAIMPPDAPLAPNPYDYDPLASVTPLGHKQLPSAYRRTPDMAQAPPCQKFRLHPQIHKAAIAASEKMATQSEISVTKMPPSNPAVEFSSDDRSVGKESSRLETEKVSRLNDSWRHYRDREKESSRENRLAEKDKYPELQYRSPLIRPGQSNNETNGSSRLVPRSYQYRSKTLKRRHPNSCNSSEHWSPVKRYSKLVIDFDSRKNDLSQSSHPEISRNKPIITTMPSTSSIARTSVEETATSSKKHLSVPEDPRRSSSESLTKSILIKNSPHRSDSRSLNLRPTHAETCSDDRPDSISSSVGQTLAEACSNNFGDGQKTCDAVPVLLVPECKKNDAELKKSVEKAERLEIGALSMTFNEDEDSTGIMTAADELAELTKVFDVDERTVEKEKKTGLSVTEHKTCKEENFVISRDSEKDELSTSRDMKTALSLRSDSPDNQTEMILQDLSSLTAEFNSVED